MSQFIGRTGISHARVWHHVDMAKETRTLGRVASAIAMTLMGKHKPIYNPAVDSGDYVVVSNCHFLNVTGKKMDQKLYRRHSGRPGNLHEVLMKDLLANKGGSAILRQAVSKMLPKNRLRKFRMERLKVFEDSTNPYGDNVIAYHDEAPQVSKILTEVAKLENSAKS
ncbi:hypothetical protein DV495_002167 [Geotrichum candidum]|uniref:Similar to Saccharomyces cerevisiae YOR150W MRPL23 Mitochondrial ribosomal protein of the large subunit n=1 Tax=Geotrichum candidum TaxID=1173061 RepID=A0A0J9XIX9_GEOCN|nr:hypothetical protein DV454_004350 [Geotrichum candidum]KAF5116065.1 hypothetical protein DV452_002773 [Geotrichum candidum]KAF5129547.1 hypothetical protein DV495_002167 [Geotrichum candidum]KAF7499954.1 hypothetical protein DV113_002007 [Geotrichum candidum]KAI8133595.1 hypothetical protein DUD61_002753 [Geotrichum candidum]